MINCPNPMFAASSATSNRYKSYVNKQSPNKTPDDERSKHVCQHNMLLTALARELRRAERRGRP